MESHQKEIFNKVSRDYGPLTLIACFRKEVEEPNLNIKRSSISSFEAENIVILTC